MYEVDVTVLFRFMHFVCSLGIYPILNMFQAAILFDYSNRSIIQTEISYLLILKQKRRNSSLNETVLSVSV